MILKYLKLWKTKISYLFWYMVKSGWGENCDGFDAVLITVVFFLSLILIFLGIICFILCPPLIIISLLTIWGIEYLCLNANYSSLLKESENIPLLNHKEFILIKKVFPESIQPSLKLDCIGDFKTVYIKYNNSNNNNYYNDILINIPYKDWKFYGIEGKIESYNKKIVECKNDLKIENLRKSGKTEKQKQNKVVFNNIVQRDIERLKQELENGGIEK